MLEARKAHFIGIGGIGVSAIARMLLSEGVAVSGSDVSRSEITDELESLGAEFRLGHQRENVPPGCDLVVYTNALSKENPELLAARKCGLKTLSYPEALGEISRDKFVIAVSGSAGKTTTTALLGQILVDAGLEPTVVVGSLAYFTDSAGKVEKTNFLFGRGKYFVVEADEYKRAFLNLNPKILAITNVEPDHLDYYRDLADLQSAFGELVAKVPSEGFIVASPKDPLVSPALEQSRAVILDYRTAEVPKNFPLPGKHNRDNAKVALTAASALGIDKIAIEKSLAKAKGPWRRFEYKGKTKNGVEIYDDYAHNPQKVRALIAGVREIFPNKRIVLVFQPHLFSRTKKLLKEFAESFEGVDRLIILPIYAAREVSDPEINHRILAEAVKSAGSIPIVETLDALGDVAGALSEEKNGSVCLLVGAGDLYTVCRTLLDN
ncbi:MAG: Mur ligase domain-containing protein [Minisyncoccia bacterium]